MAEDTAKILVDFAEADAAKDWQTINNGVMGASRDCVGPEAMKFVLP